MLSVICLRRVKVYIENGWAYHIINPDGITQLQSSEGLAEVDSSVSPPSYNWMEKYRKCISNIYLST